MTITATPTLDRTTSDTRTRGGILPTIILLIGAIYCLVPVVWVVVASSKSPGELFSTFTFAPGTGLLQNISDLFAYGDGQYALWALNSLLYAGVGAVLSTVVSAMAGFALAKYDFPGRNLIFYSILGGVLIPGITLAIPQYLLLSGLGMAGSYWSVLLPSIISPFGIYLCRVYAQAAVPAETIEAARIDGANEWQVFRRITVPMLAPVLGVVLVTLMINVLKIFDLIVVIAPGSSRDDANVLAVQLYDSAFGDRDLGVASAIAVLLFLLVMPVMVTNVRRLRKEARR